MTSTATNPDAKARRDGGRHFYLDALRSLAILCVIFLHCMNPVITNAAYYGGGSWLMCLIVNPLCRAGVPLFFMISGHLLLSDPLTAEPKRFYRKRLPRILLPLLVWNVLYYIKHIAAGGDAGLLDFFRQLINLGTAYHMWYVYTLAGIYLLAPFFKRLCDACSNRQLWLFVLLAVAMCSIRPFINTLTPLYINLHEPLIDCYLVFFLLGHALGRSAPSRRWRALVYLGGLLGALVSIFGNLHFSSAEGIDLPFNLGNSFTHYLVAAALFTLARAVFEGREPPRALRRMAEALSGLSFGIYWVHVMALSVLTSFAVSASPAVNVLFYFVCTTAASTAAAAVIRLARPVRRFLM